MKQKKFYIGLSSILLCVAALTGCDNESSKSKVVDSSIYTIDFSKKVGDKVQLLKKIDGHCPVWYLKGNMGETTNPDAMDALKTLEGLNEETMRTDVFFGNYGAGYRVGNSDTSNGTNPNEYSLLKLICNEMHSVGIEPYLVMNGIPKYAQTDGNFYKTPNYDKYYELVYNFAKYLGDNDLAKYYETWNEPDLGNWSSDFYDLMKMSAVQTKAIYDANPNATVSALGLAFASKWLNRTESHSIGGGQYETISHWDRFVQQCAEYNAFPDAFAWHYYGSEEGDVKTNFDDADNFDYQVDFLQKKILKDQEEHPELKKMSQHLTEYHPVSTAASVEDTTMNIKSYFESVEPLLNATDVTKAHWPMFLMDQFGVVDKGSHRLNPTYQFLWVYGRMPVDRVEDVELPAGVSSYTSCDSKRASVVFYNTGNEERNFNVNFLNVGFSVDTTDVYKISTEHLNYQSEIFEPYHISHKTGLKDKVTINLKKNEAVYVEINDEDHVSEQNIHPASAELIKKEYYFQDRSTKMPYAEIAKDSLIAYTSMAGNQEGLGTCSARLKMKSDNLTIKFDTWGNFEKTDNSALAIRVDYRMTNGEYKNSVYYTFNDMNKEVILPFGTQRAADEIIKIEQTNGKFTLKLANKAPQNWSNEIAITFIMQDAGSNATAKFSIL